MFRITVTSAVCIAIAGVLIAIASTTSSSSLKMSDTSAAQVSVDPFGMMVRAPHDLPIETHTGQ